MRKVKLKSGKKIYSNESLAINLYKKKSGDVIIKSLKNTNFHSFYSYKLINEFELTKDFYVKGTRKALWIENKDKFPELCLEYTNGKTISEIIKNQKNSVSSLLNIFIDIVEILYKIHKAKIVHNNINSNNIIVGENNKITIIDFGLAFKSNEAIPDQTNFMDFINLNYSSPEQIESTSSYIDFRSDLYSLGIVFYEMMIGYLPFIYSDRQELINAHLLEIPLSLHDIDKSIPKTISNIVSKLIRKHNEDRYQTSLELLIKLKKCREEINDSKQNTTFELDKIDHGQINTKGLLNANKDLRTIINASIALSEKATLDNVLINMLNIFAKNTDADKIHYLVNDNFNTSEKKEKWLFQARIDLKNNKIETLQNEDFEKTNKDKNGAVCHSIISQVINTKSLIMINNLSEDGRFGVNELKDSDEMTSILCVPIEYQGELHSIFYIENNEITKAFTLYNVQILSVLFQLLAVSYENSRLFSNLNSKVNQLEISDSILHHKTNELESVYEGIIDGLMIFDPITTEVIKTNKVLSEITGYTAEELIQLGSSGLFPSESISVINEQLKRLYNNEIDIVHDIPILIKKGHKKWVDIKSQIIKYDNKSVVIGFYRDVTHQYHKNELIEEKTYELNKAQEIGDMGSWVWNIETGHIAWSDQIYRIFGFQPQEFDASYEAFLQFVHPEDLDIVVTGVDLALKKEKQYDVEHRVVWEDGTIRIVNERGEVFFDDTGKASKMIGTVKDITEVKVAEEAKKESDKKYKQLFEIAQEGIWVLDQGYYTNFVNPSMARMLGYTIEEMKGKHFFDFVDEKGMYMAKYMLEGGEEGVKKQHDFELFHKNKKNIIVASECTVITDDEGNNKGYLIGMMDITSRKKIEEQLRDNENNLEHKIYERTLEVEERNMELNAINEELKATNDQLMDTLDILKSTQSQLIQSEKMASLGVLTAGIAHEINNPINFVYAGINSLEENLKDVKKVLEAYNNVNENNVAKKLNEIREIKSVLQFDKLLDLVDRLTLNIKNGAERTTEIIKGLKTFSREDNDKFTRVNIHDSLEDALLLLNSQITENITVKKQYGKTPEIDCYSSKINQVFINIIGNALQSVDTKGVIVISTSQVTRKKKEYVKVAIKDSGTGMSKDIQNRIFEPFYTTKEVGKGTGLGLSICHNIIKNHNGFIEVDSKLGKGTTMNIFLPVKV
ncbi:MAG: PAS domain S-box protein [Cyclobacteriaceae bacterium]|nr:PAS domain S-box protein [Cyclobacteriaceae bacterium]